MARLLQPPGKGAPQTQLRAFFDSRNPDSPTTSVTPFQHVAGANDIKLSPGRLAVAKLTAEFVGTAVIVFVAGGAADIFANGVAGSALVDVALSYGLAIATMCYVFQHVSGGQFNPGVTFAAWWTWMFNGALNPNISSEVDGKEPADSSPRSRYWMEFAYYTGEMLLYWVAQIGGAVVGWFLLWAITGGATGAAVGVVGKPTGASIFNVKEWIRVGGSEFFGSFIIQVVYLMGAMSAMPIGLAHRHPDRSHMPMYYGFVTVVLVLALYPVTGASFNPARMIGPCIGNPSRNCGSGAGGSDWAAYVFMPLLASFFSSVAVYFFFRFFLRPMPSQMKWTEVTTQT